MRFQWSSRARNRRVVACEEGMADEAAQLTGDLGGPPRLAAWQQAQRAEKERLSLLAASNVTAAAAYEPAGWSQPMVVQRSSGYY